MLDLNAGRVPFLFFLKAVQKKQIYIPAFVRADGTAVAGHMKWVHVADDHEDHKVAGGQGTHSQKIAHGKLSKHDWFHALPTEHKAAIVMAHATDHQSMESAGSRVSKMRDKIFKGIAPSAGEWRAWGYIDAERRQKVFDEIKASGRISFFEQSMNADEVAKGAEDRKERLEHQPAAAADDKPAPAVEQPKVEPAAPAAPTKPEPTPEPKAAPAPAAEAPKPAPKAEEPAKPAAPPQKAASGSPEHQAVLDAIDAKMLPADAVNAYANVKYKLIKQMFEAGDAKGLLNLTYGTNPYGKFAAKLANMALKVLGSEHQVAPGQKAGTHPALAGDVMPKKAEAAPAAAPAKEEPKDEPKSEPAAEPQPAAPAQPEEAAPAAATEKVSDSDSLPAAGALAMPAFDGGSIGAKVTDYYEGVAQKIIDMAGAGDVAGLEKMKADGLKPKANGGMSKTFAGKTPNSKILLALHDAALAQAKGAAGDAPVPAAAPAVDAGPKEGDTKPAADGGTLVLKDGHWIKKDEPQAAAAAPKTFKQQILAAEDAASASGLKGQGMVAALYAAVKQIMDANPGKEDEINSALDALGYDKLKSAAPVGLTDAEIGEKPAGVSSIMHAKAVAHAKAGDLAALQALHKDVEAMGLPNTAAHIASVVDALQAKQGMAQPAAAPQADAGAPELDAWLKDGPTGPGALALAKQYVSMEGGTPEAHNDAIASLKKHGYAEAAEALLFDKLNAPLDKPAPDVDTPPAAAAADDGPQDGDTKQGATGMLVFKDGHWHKVADLVAGVPLPKKLTGTNAVKMNKMVKAMQEIAKAEGAAGLAKVVMQVPSGASTKVKAAGYNFTISNDPDVASSNGTKMITYGKALLAALGGAPGSPKVVGVKVAPIDAPAEAPAFLASNPADKVAIDGWTKTADKKGFNEGGFYTSPDGQQWYCKFPSGGDPVVKNELLANRLAALAGLNVPDLQMVTQGGKVGLASKIIPGAKEDKAALLAGKAKGLLESFAAHAWLANWDAVGNNPSKGFDNILVDDKNVAHHIDQGGALLFGGAGGSKGQFGDKVIELTTMLDPGKNANTAAVFGKMSPIDIAASVATIISIPDQQIENFVMAYGPGGAADKAALAAKLIARKNDMAAQCPQAVEIAKKMGKKAGQPAPQEKPKLDPTNLPVTLDKLPKPHDFMNWQNSGKPISDKPYVAFNIKAENDIIAAAMKGDLIALQNYKYMAVEQATGKELGLKSMADHPSNHVKEFWQACVDHLDAIAHPPELLKDFDGILSDGIKELSDSFPPKLFGVGINNVPANEKLGFWIALGVSKGVERFKPKNPKDAHKLVGIKDKAKALFQSYKKVVKQFIAAVQGSGSANQPYRDGKEVDTNGNSTREVLRELYKCAQHKPEGTTLTKWIDFYPGMIDQFEANPEGLVFQNPGSMCCSMHPTATKDKGFGHHRVTIRFAEGATACDTFGSGGFSSEMEITTLPGARFMVLNKGWGVDGDKSRYNLEVLMLPPDQTYVNAI